MVGLRRYLLAEPLFGDAVRSVAGLPPKLVSLLKCLEAQGEEVRITRIGEDRRLVGHVLTAEIKSLGDHGILVEADILDRETVASDILVRIAHSREGG